MSEISQEDRLAALLLRWEESWELGDDLPASQLCTDCPDVANQLQANIDVLKKMAWMKKDAANEVQSDGDDAVADPFVGKTLAGRYRIDQFIGEGGFGQVYRAFDTELQRAVAIKIAHHKARTGGDDLLQEARRVAKLRHAGIVAVHDVGHDEQILFVVSDFIEGQSLAQLLEAKPPVPWDAAKLVARIAEALHFAHEQGFVHRDIKPANILIDQQGQPLIADFGIAATSEELTQGTHLSSGTLPYMAPEQVAGEVQLVDGRTDVYSLGVVLYEMLTGRTPHEARTPTALREQILFRAPLRLDAPAELQQVCLRCLAKHPADRFPTAQALAEALRQAVTGKAHAQRWRVTLIVLLLAVLAIATVVGIRFLPSLLESRTGTFVKEGAFVFDGTNRIVTPVERFAPVTLEAWIRPERYEYRCQCVVGSDIPTEYGIGLGISGVLLCAEYLQGMYQSKQIVPLREWSHLAAVFAPGETRLYLNGKQVATGPATQVRGGARFVIGNVGPNNPNDYFVGQVRAVRISKGERYTGNFVPDQEFTKDPDDSPCRALLIYGEGAMHGGKVTDLTGNGNDGVPEKLPP